LFAVACQKEDPKMNEVLSRLEKIDQRLEGIEKRGVGGAAAARPERKRPDPSLTYQVPVESTDVVKARNTPR
jgi:hypothetical protein